LDALRHGDGLQGPAGGEIADEEMKGSRDEERFAEAGRPSVV
jgi:hypothetical protein